MQKLLPDADASIAEGDFIYLSGLNTFNNMRYQFMKAIRLAMILYKTSHIRYIISLVLVFSWHTHLTFTFLFKQSEIEINDETHIP